MILAEIRTAYTLGKGISLRTRNGYHHVKLH